MLGIYGNSQAKSQLLNAFSPILAMVIGKIKSPVKPEYEKALGAIVVTLLPK